MFVVVRCASPADVTLEDAGNLRELYVAAGGCPDAAAVGRTLDQTGAGSLAEDGAHAWLSVDWLRARGAAGQGPSWSEGFEGMLAYAAGQGWLGPAGTSVRAHLR